MLVCNGDTVCFLDVGIESTVTNLGRIHDLFKEQFEIKK
jgi:hypothetical protein